MNVDDKTEAETGESGGSGSRRTFMTVATLAMGGVIGLVMSVPLLRYFFYPAGRAVVSGGDGPIDAIGADELVRGADPVKVTLVGQAVRDAWGVADDTNLGAAWVQRSDDDSVVAFTSVCPHLGCAVDFDSESSTFRCPCHRSAFAKSGDRIEGPSKRGLDPLPVVVEEGRVRISYKRYVTDVADRIEKA